jgi:hypothetical protein
LQHLVLLTLTYIQTNRTLLPVAPTGVAIRPAERWCPAALKSRIGGPYSSALSVISLQSHCTEITDVCIQISDDVHDKFRPRFECKSGNNGGWRPRLPGAQRCTGKP